MGNKRFFGDRVLTCSATRSYARTSWRFNNGIDLQTARVREGALVVAVLVGVVSETMGIGAADLCGKFVNTNGLRAAKFEVSSSGGRMLCRILKGMARFGTVDLVGWRRSGLVPRTARR